MASRGTKAAYQRIWLQYAHKMKINKAGDASLPLHSDSNTRDQQAATG